MNPIAKFLIALVLTTVSPLHGLSQTPGPVRAKAGLVTFDVLVQKRSTGQAIVGLNKQDFTVYENDVKQAIETFSADVSPASIVLLLDLSWSMDMVVRTIREAPPSMWNQLEADDEVAILTFAKDVEVVRPLSRDKHLLNEQIARVYSVPDQGDRGQTNLNEAIYRAAVYLKEKSKPEHERSILIISDGQTNQERGHSRKQAFQELADCNCVTYSLTVAASGLVFLDTSLEDYAVETGGLSVTTEERALRYHQKLEFNEKLSVLVNLLHKRYRISYRAVNTKADGKYRKIKVQISPVAAQRFGKVDVLCRRGYYAQ